VAPVQAFGYAQEDGLGPYYLLTSFVQGCKFRVLFARHGLAVEKGRGSHYGELILAETEEVGIPDEVGAVGLVIAVGEIRTDIVELSRVKEELPLLPSLFMEADGSCAVKKLKGQTCNGLCVLFIKAESPSQLENT
jgi:hypothetical protein